MRDTLVEVPDTRYERLRPLVEVLWKAVEAEAKRRGYEFERADSKTCIYGYVDKRHFNICLPDSGRKRPKIVCYVSNTSCEFKVEDEFDLGRVAKNIVTHCAMRLPESDPEA